MTPWTAARQAPLSMGFPRQEHWSGLPFLSPRDLPDPGIEHMSPALQVDSLPQCIYVDPNLPIQQSGFLVTIYMVRVMPAAINLKNWMKITL